jgi:O-acetylserine/cysteine efflux transporter
VHVLRTDGTAGVTMAGLALNLAAAFMWAMANIIVKAMQVDRPPFSPLALIVWSSLVAAASFALLSFVFDPVAARRNWLEASLVGWCSAAYIGWAANLVGYGLWTALLHRHHANRIAPFSLGMPVVGLLAGMLVLDEVVDLVQWTGAILVMSALVFVVRGSSAEPAGRT